MTHFRKENVVRLDEAIPARGFVCKQRRRAAEAHWYSLLFAPWGPAPPQRLFHCFIHVIITIKMKLSTIQRTTCFSLIGISF